MGSISSVRRLDNMVSRKIVRPQRTDIINSTKSMLDQIDIRLETLKALIEDAQRLREDVRALRSSHCLHLEPELLFIFIISFSILDYLTVICHCL